MPNLIKCGVLFSLPARLLLYLIYKILSQIKAKFILSINDHEVVRNTFKEFKIKPVTLKYSAAKDKNTEGKELLVTNF